MEAMKHDLCEQMRRDGLPSSPRSASLYIRELKRQISDRKEAERKLIMKMEQMRANFKNEQLLISNAFYTIGLQAHNQQLLNDRTPLPAETSPPSTKSSSKSWLSKQRSKAQRTRR